MKKKPSKTEGFFISFFLKFFLSLLQSMHYTLLNIHGILIGIVC